MGDGDTSAGHRVLGRVRVVFQPLLYGRQVSFANEVGEFHQISLNALAVHQELQTALAESEHGTDEG